MVVAHIIAGLNDGGAEGVLYRLCKFDDKNMHVVISLSDMGRFGPLLQDLGVRVECLGLQRGSISLNAVWRLWQLLRQSRPHAVQTWMYHADLLGGVVARVANIRNIVWGIRHSELEVGSSSRSTIFAAVLCARLSHWIPRRIVVCAQRAIDVHADMGYDGARMVLIPNGFDLQRFKKGGQTGLALRESLGVPPEVTLIGMVSRYNLKKDHANLLHAMGMLKTRGLSFLCVPVGPGLSENVILNKMIIENNLLDHVKILGQREDIPEIMNSLDIHVLSSSFGEAFPNVLAEAMACGTPCVTTDVGDSATIVGETGWVVPPRNSELLAEAISASFLERLGNPIAWAARANACRERIEKNFDIKAMIKSYQKVWSFE